ncbi:MAG TPA: PLP-dependent cysteine synthase family protein [Amycolatopsis sp.]|nr:PLP-dependent cysteine synthase family protein [Amycolatopsis sp.]
MTSLSLPAPPPLLSGVEDVNRYDPDHRTWTGHAIAKILAEANRTSDTSLVSVPLPREWGVDLYLKDESTHPTGSLKHRLARSLFLFGLCNGWIREGRLVVEASSGSTAVSEAYFAQLIGVEFVAVMARSTSPEKVKLIEMHGGRCHFVDDPSTVYDVAATLAGRHGGHYMDQFTYAERATDWRGNNNIAESIFSQMVHERHPEPAWIVVTAGTGGTSATMARYVRFTRCRTGICVADPENSAFFPAWRDQDGSLTTGRPSRIEGIGRQRMEPSFVPAGVDRMMRIPDGASIAAIQFLDRLIGRRTGASTGTGLWAALKIVAEMVEGGRKGSVVSLICDSGERYLDSYYSTEWLHEHGIDPGSYLNELDALFTGHFR